MIDALLFIGYWATVLIVGRIIYTKRSRGDWFTDVADHEVGVLFAVAMFWPAALIIWAVYRFVTGGVRK